MPGPLVPGPFPGSWAETIPGRHRRHGGDGEVLGGDTAGPGGRERGPGGRGAGGGAGRPAEQFAGLLAWAADEAGYLDHGEREEVIGAEGRELQRRLLQATFDLDAAREERIAQVTSAAGIRHGTVEAGHGRGLASVFGPVRVTRMAYRNRREPNLYPADARQVLPDDPYSLGMRALAAYHLATSGYGQAQEIIEARTGVTAGRAQLAGLAGDLAAWTGDFYEERARDAEEEEQPDSDVIMMQGDGKGIALRPEHRKGGGTDPAHTGIKKMAEIVAVADFTPAVREPEDIAAPPARRKAHPGPVARGKWVSASITDDIPAVIAAAFDEAERRDPDHSREWAVLIDGNNTQIEAVTAGAASRGIKITIVIDFIHVLEYLWKAAWSFSGKGEPAAEEWAAAQARKILHGKARQVAAGIRRRATTYGYSPAERAGADECARYLENKNGFLDYATALKKGWPIATGIIEGACRSIVKDRMVFSSRDHAALCPLRCQTVLVRYGSAAYRHPRAGVFRGGEPGLPGVPGRASRRPGVLDRGRRRVCQGSCRRPVLVRSSLRP